MINTSGSDYYAVLEKTTDLITSGDLIYKLSCQLGTQSTSGSYTGSQITFRNGLAQTMSGTQTATTMYVQAISLATGI